MTRAPWIIAADARRFEVRCLRDSGEERIFSKHTHRSVAEAIARKLARAGLRTRVHDLLAEGTG